jgi:hypothetical protein
MPREKILPVMTTKFMNDLELMNIVDHTKLGNFLVKLQNTYQTEITYHNDLHGADVMQFAYYLMMKGNLIEIIHLDKLDCMSLIIAAAAHDLGHDGFNNNYHVNAITQRAIDSNDNSVQETYHAAELFRIFNTPGLNFIEDLHREQFASFRKRVVGLILATDMARHARDMASLNEQISMIKNEHKTVEEVYFSGDENVAQTFKNQ